MSFGTDDLIKMEQLAVFKFRPQERELAIEIIDEFLELADMLTQCDDGGAQPLVSVLSLGNVFREDEAIKAVSRDELFEIAPSPSDCYYSAPQTFD